ncbi:Hypp6625 [Branchiostoma lanceolatum]|uniref:Hypp6625 protein n=1 Tax=Branchiostoma lanceolatum TaxID=7740 RepID=A0A8K0E5E6_BRALA|nr:Hypp6625 [Branchiostoma lanceolatum]
MDTGHKSTLPQAPAEHETLQQQKTDLLLAVQRERLAKEVRVLEADLRALQLDVPSSQLSAIPPGAQPQAATHPGATTPVATPPGATPPVAPPPVAPPPVAPPPVAPPPVVPPPIVPPPILLRTSSHLEEAFSTDRIGAGGVSSAHNELSSIEEEGQELSGEDSDIADGVAELDIFDDDAISVSQLSDIFDDVDEIDIVPDEQLVAALEGEVSVLDSGMQVDTSDGGVEYLLIKCGTVKAVHFLSVAFNPDQWPNSTDELLVYGEDYIEFLIEYFQDILDRKGCDVEQCQDEWRTMKMTVRRSFNRGTSYNNLYEALLTKEPHCTDFKVIVV